VSLLPPFLKPHFLAPKRVADPSRASHRGESENQACGDRLELGLWVQGGRVERACFRARGCSAVIACASWVCDRLEGQSLEQLEKLDVGALLAEAGGLPATGAHAARVVERSLRGALASQGASPIHPRT